MQTAFRKSLRFQLSVLAIALALAAPAVAAPAAAAQQRIKVIIDTDIAEDIDDILVTAYALAAPEFEVLAITTVDGNVQARSRVARKVALLWGRPTVMVAAGYTRNLPYTDVKYEGLSGGVRYGEVALSEEGLPPESPLKADELIARLAERYPGEVTLVTIGSTSNVGHLLVKYPESALKLKAIITNGGYADLDQGVQRIGWNLRYDPVAAALLVRGMVPWVLLSEGASRFAGPREEDVARLRAAGLPTTELLVQAIDLWHKNKPDATPQPHVSDLNVFAYLLGLIETQPANVFFEVGPPGQLPGFRMEPDPAGKVAFGWLIPKDQAATLRRRMIDLLCAPPAGKD